jgi:N6-adenosine-specific RNA methylase IME4
MSLEEICSLGPQILDVSKDPAHLYLWVPTALLNWGLRVIASWGFEYKTAIYWSKVTKDGAPDRRCMGFYWRNVIEPCLFATRGKLRTIYKNVPNIIETQKRGHSVKPDEMYDIIERQSPGPYLELFARTKRPGWSTFGNELENDVVLIVASTHVSTWREVVAEVLSSGTAEVKDIYSAAITSPKVVSAIEAGHNWRAQIRRTLQKHFFPEGRGMWRTS